MLMNDITCRQSRPDLDHRVQEDIVGICQMFHTLPIQWVEPGDICNAALFLAPCYPSRRTNPAASPV